VLDVPLLNFEVALFDSIEFDPQEKGLDDQRIAENAELAGILATAVLDRGALPEHRLDYLNNPDHGGPSGVSVIQKFAEEGLSGEALHRDVRFLKYLRYLLCGPHLPQPIVKSFITEVENRTSDGEVDNRRVLLKVRELARKSRSPSTCAEDFYMLALECNLDQMLARDIRRVVARMK